MFLILLSFSLIIIIHSIDFRFAERNWNTAFFLYCFYSRRNDMSAMNLRIYEMRNRLSFKNTDDIYKISDEICYIGATKQA